MLPGTCTSLPCPRTLPFSFTSCSTAPQAPAPHLQLQLYRPCSPALQLLKLLNVFSLPGHRRAAPARHVQGRPAPDRQHRGHPRAAPARRVQGLSPTALQLLKPGLPYCSTALQPLLYSWTAGGARRSPWPSFPPLVIPVDAWEGPLPRSLALALVIQWQLAWERPCPRSLDPALAYRSEVRIPSCR